MLILQIWYKSVAHAISTNKLSKKLIPLPVPERPWQCISADYFYNQGVDYLLVVDNYSKWPEVTRVSQKTAEATIKSMKEIFAREGIPEEIVCDNMPFDSARFRAFCKSWGIKVTTSSPHYPKSHGQVERFVQTMKQMLNKAADAGEDAYLALLELRNTPISGMNYSPAELLKGRKLKSILPTTKKSLVPKVAENVREQLLERQVHQKRYHDKGAKDLKPLEPGSTARIRAGGVWEPGVVMSKHETPRSYNVMNHHGTMYRRNRSHLLATREPTPTIHRDNEVSLHDQPDANNTINTKTREIKPEPSNIRVKSKGENAQVPKQQTMVQRTRCGCPVKLPARYRDAK